jgi:hypothetical protein
MVVEAIDTIRAGAEPGQVYAVAICIEISCNAVKDGFDLLCALTRPNTLCPR